PALDEVFARMSADGSTAFYLTDHLGSVHQLASIDGTILDQIDYSDFGLVTSETHPEANVTFKFDGMLADPAIAGEYHDRARIYDAIDAVFEGKDPDGFAAGDVNTSRFVGNFVTGMIDPTGLHGYGNGSGRTTNTNSNSGAAGYNFYRQTGRVPGTTGFWD